ncbi:bcl-2-like protein 13 [Hypomesus transpacificus]|uniref:bcl-2-like protein 13 n=1 Tax=Hypomesus transpacificus TaxID=137520 RepID=UPI001F0802F1|nr:bcl-2-like protein 13 [Hypomesus transpacificus]XP_046878975.1 bcl-2-like protein 13 [Hypomesus transpacificus]
MGDMDREDTKSLDSSDGMILPEERSENHSSVSDMVHLEREEAELLEEEDLGVEDEEEGTLEEDEEEMQSSMLSMLGGERELAELRGEISSTHPRAQADQGLRGPETVELLMSMEDPFQHLAHVTHVTPPMAMPVVKLEPPSATSTPVPSIPTAAEVAEQLYSMQELHPPPVLPQPQLESQTDSHCESTGTLPDAAEPTITEVQEKTQPEASLTPSHTEMPVLLCGCAALVAIVGVAAYGAMVYCRK